MRKISYFLRNGIFFNLRRIIALNSNVKEDKTKNGYRQIILFKLEIVLEF